MTGFAWDWNFAWASMPALLSGFRLTVLATLFGSAIALTLGLFLCVLQMARIPILSRTITVLIQLLRGTPLLIQLYFVFYVVPIWGLSMPALVTGVIGLGLYYSAYAAEIYRGGIEDLPIGQWEASLTLGIPLRRVWLGIMLPQAIRSVLPVLGNLIIAMFKESALLSTITIMELLAQGKNIGSIEFRYIEPLTLVGMLYFTISYSAARIIRRLEDHHAAGT